MSAISRSCLIFVSSILFPPGINNSPAALAWLLILCILLLTGGICMKGWSASLLLYLSVYSFGLLCVSRYEYKSVAKDRIIKIINQSFGRSNLLINKVGKTKKGYRLECRFLFLNSTELSHLNISCLLYTPSLSADLQKADTLSVQLPFKKIRKESNPVKFDKKAYYQSKGIFHEGFINDKLELEYKGFYSSTNHPIASTRNRIAKKIQNLKLKKKSKAFMHALILGNKSHMHSSTLESFADTGCIHVLAVSGLHTGIIFSLFSPFLYFLRFKHDLRWLTLAMVIGLLYIFVSICGYPPSAVRASCMLSLWLLIKCLGISHNAFSILALTAFVVLMIQPVQIDQLGFKLSYLALTGIIVLYNKIPFRDNPHIQSIWASPFRMIWLSICAQYFLSPLLLLEMNSFAPYFAVSSMIAVPFIYIIMLLSIIVIISHRFIPLLNNILDTLISSLTNTIAFIEKWPLSTINEVYFTELAFGISFIFLTLLSIGLAYQNKVILVFALSILFSIIPCLQAQRLHQLHTVDITIFHKTLGSLVTVHHHGLEHVVFQSGRNNKDYLLSKQRIKHSIHSKSHNPIQPPVIIQSENLSLMIADSENEVCSISCIPAYLDFLLLTKANRNKLYKLMACIDIKMVIIDGSTTYDNKNQIIELLHNLGIQYHDTNTKGYWNYKFLNI